MLPLSDSALEAPPAVSPGRWQQFLEMAKSIQILTIILLLSSCGQKETKMNTPENASEKFETFLNKEKFIDEPYPNFYPGLNDEVFKSVLTEKINQIASDFKNVALSENPTSEKYQESIKNGLSSFSSIYLDLDTEDRERVCSYIEELMDIVELESSNGQLNQFLYGFDPSK